MAQNSQLLAEGEVLEHEMPSRSQGGGERAQQNKGQGAHGMGSVTFCQVPVK